MALPEFGATPTPAPAEPAQGLESLLADWSSFADAWLLLDMTIVLLLALFLGAILAYHPSTRRRVSSLDHYEQPKTFLMYAMVSAVVALIVKVQPAMAFVIFGIGGLLRFRSMVGESQDTGRVILVTMVGLCCGLKIYVVAVLATLLGWIVVYVLERELSGIIRIAGVSEQALHEATRAYREKIAASGCTIIGEQTKFIKREFMFVVTAPPTLNRDQLEDALEELPEELRGVVAFERL